MKEWVILALAVASAALAAMPGIISAFSPWLVSAGFLSEIPTDLHVGIASNSARTVLGSLSAIFLLAFSCLRKKRRFG